MISGHTLENSEFVLSKLDSAITRVRGIELMSYATTGCLGLASFFLALSAVVPVSDLASVRVLLLATAVLPILVLYWLLRRLTNDRKMRLNMLHKWHRETFLSRKKVDSLDGEKVRRMLELIQLMEEPDVSRSRHANLDKDFMTNLMGQSSE
jgi:hypothetical protein